MISGVALISSEQVLKTSIRLDVVERPVSMFTTTIDFLERLFMEQGSQAVLFKYFLQYLHGDHILVNGKTCIIADGGNLKLVQCYFIVLCLERNANRKQLFLHLKQSVSDILGDRAVVVFA